MNNAAVILLTAVMASVWPIARTFSSPSPANNLAFSRSVDAAYRDGLYLGRLDAQDGLRPRAAIFRWNQEADRDLFRAGYNTGYSKAIAMVR